MMIRSVVLLRVAIKWQGAPPIMAVLFGYRLRHYAMIVCTSRDPIVSTPPCKDYGKDAMTVQHTEVSPPHLAVGFLFFELQCQVSSLHTDTKFSHVIEHHDIPNNRGRLNTTS